MARTLKATGVIDSHLLVSPALLRLFPENFPDLTEHPVHKNEIVDLSAFYLRANPFHRDNQGLTRTLQNT